MIRSFIVGMALAVVIYCGSGAGQVADKEWEFEVASVKPALRDQEADTTRRGGPGTRDPGQVIYEHTWLPSLVADAYQVRVDQISRPDWMDTEAYSIVAKIPPNTTKDQFCMMLRNLLAERFHLRLHRETKTVPVYILSVAPGGPKLSSMPADGNTAMAPTDGSSCIGSAKNRFPALPPGRTEAHVWCPGVAYYTYRQTMGEFALGLGALVNMSNGDGIVRGGPPLPFVANETRLAERFEFTLEFAGSVLPSSAAHAAGAAAQPADNQAVPLASIAEVSGGGRSLFGALEKQLGLKLEKGKRPVDFLIIDQADKVPTGN